MTENVWGVWERIVMAVVDEVNEIGKENSAKDIFK
jgi:hypothetical protein